MAHTAFISHASEDEDVANTICAYLERNAVSCWIAPRDVRPGSDYGSEIIDGIKSSSVFVLVLSEHANTSEFVKREVERAVSKGKPIFPVRVREVVPSKSLELFISSAEWIDAWQPPIEQYLEKLAESIRSAAALYPTGRGDAPGTGPAAPAVHPPEHVTTTPPPSSAGTSPAPQRALVVAVVALLAVVLVLAALLARNMFRQPETPSSSTSATSGTTNSPAGSDPAAAGTAAVEPPKTPGSTGTAAGLSPTDPCPRYLGINRELPTPFTCNCSAQSTAEGTVWGTDVYTDDSSLCRAAVHAGVISAQGGSVTVNRGGGLPLSIGTTRNGVMSNDGGAFPVSIQFKGSAPVPPGPGLCPRYLGINRELPTPFTCRCTAESTQSGTVWGSDIYTDDSSMCRAALHAGRVSAQGGTITAVRGDGRALYIGSTRNGVSSADYGSFPASITFK
jgi:hypothetical protein